MYSGVADKNTCEITNEKCALENWRKQYGKACIAFYSTKGTDLMHWIQEQMRFTREDSLWMILPLMEQISILFTRCNLILSIASQVRYPCLRPCAWCRGYQTSLIWTSLTRKTHNCNLTDGVLTTGILATKSYSDSSQSEDWQPRNQTHI